MSEEEVRVTRVVNIHAQPVNITLIRGQRGVYRWQIVVHAEDIEAALDMLDKLDKKLRTKYLGEKVEEEAKKETKRREVKKFNIDEVKKFIQENKELLMLVETSEGFIVKPRKWIGDRWGELNEKLKKLGFEWESAGKDSCWVKKKEK